MISVGIDISKGKSMVCFMKPYREMLHKPFEVQHTESALETFGRESTGAYHFPVLTYLKGHGIFAAVINPLVMSRYVKVAIRKGKTDKLDAIKIANFGLDHWYHLVDYSPTADVYEELKTLLRNRSDMPDRDKLCDFTKDECFGITGIRQKDIDNGIPLENALHKLRNMASAEDISLVAWGKDDRRVLANICEKYGLSYPFRYENYLDLAAAYPYYRNFKNLSSLRKAIETTGIEMIGIQHSAMDDAINTASVMREMIHEGWKVEPSSIAPKGENPIPHILLAA